MVVLWDTLISKGQTCMGLGGGLEVGCKKQNLTNSNCSTFKKKAHITRILNLFRCMVYRSTTVKVPMYFLLGLFFRCDNPKYGKLVIQAGHKS
jgi:hypothetical protein